MSIKDLNVFCIVVTYNGSQWIEKCLGSLMASSVPLKILAIDNGSTDNTVECLKENFPQVAIIETGKNLGFGKANNIGLRRAVKERADYVVLINQDVWLTSNDTIEKLIEVNESNPEYGIISCLHLMNEKQLEYYFSTIINAFDCPSLISDFVVNNTLKEVYPIRFVHAAFWVIPFKCLNTVGYFDPLFWHYSEDNDYAERVKYFGFKIGISPHVSIVHDIGERSISNDKSLNFQKLNLLLQLKDLRIELAKLLYSFLWQRAKLILNLMFKLKIKEVGFHIKLIDFVLKNYSKIKSNRNLCLHGGKFE